MQIIPSRSDDLPVRPARVSRFAVYHGALLRLLEQARADLPRSEFGDLASIVRVKLDQLESLDRRAA